MTNYTANVNATIAFETAKTPINARITVAKQKRIARLVKLREMSTPINTMTSASELHDDTIYTLLYVDAVRNDTGWDWDTITKVKRDIILSDDSDVIGNSRKFLKWLRDEGWLTDKSKGKVKVNFNDSPNIIIIENKNTGEPLVALSSIH